MNTSAALSRLGIGRGRILRQVSGVGCRWTIADFSFPIARALRNATFAKSNVQMAETTFAYERVLIRPKTISKRETRTCEPMFSPGQCGGFFGRFGRRIAPTPVCRLG